MAKIGKARSGAAATDSAAGKDYGERDGPVRVSNSVNRRLFEPLGRE